MKLKTSESSAFSLFSFAEDSIAKSVVSYGLLNAFALKNGINDKNISSSGKKIFLNFSFNLMTSENKYLCFHNSNDTQPFVVFQMQFVFI